MKVRANIFTILLVVLSCSSVRDGDGQSKQLKAINLAHGEVYLTVSNQSHEAKAISVAHSEVNFTASKGGDSNVSATKVYTSRVASFAIKEKSEGNAPRLLPFVAADARSRGNALNYFGNETLFVVTRGRPISKIYASPGPDDMPTSDRCYARLPHVEWLPYNQGTMYRAFVEASWRVFEDRQALEFISRDMNDIQSVILYNVDTDEWKDESSYPVFDDPTVKREAEYLPQPQLPRASPGFNMARVMERVARTLDIEMEVPDLRNARQAPPPSKLRKHNPPGRSHQ